MTPDESYSVLGLAALLVVVTQKQFSHRIMEALLVLTRPGATVLLLGGLVFLYHNGLHYSFLVFSMLSVFLLADIWKHWVSSDARRLMLEIGRDQDRFDPSSSIDIQFANGSVTHAPPSMYAKDGSRTLLVFPPSAETQAEMNGV
jgi:hypothetical protein